MRGLKFIVFFFLLNLYNANSEVLDSLQLKADGYRISDTIRAGVLNSLAVELSSSDYEKGLKYADSAIVLSTAIKADKKLATAYFAKARNLSSGGDDSLAIINYQKAYLLYLKTGNFMACATSLQNMGISYYNLSDYSLAAERHSAVSRRLKHTVKRRIKLTEVFYIEYGFDFFIFRTYPAEKLARAVG